MNEDNIIEKIVDNTSRLDRIEEDVHAIKEKMDMFDTVLQDQDQIIKILTNMQTEMAATNHDITRHEDRIATLEHDVSTIKKQLQLA